MGINNKFVETAQQINIHLWTQLHTNQVGRGHWTVNYTGTQSFITTFLFCNLKKTSELDINTH